MCQLFLQVQSEVKRRKAKQSKVTVTCASSLSSFKAKQSKAKQSNRSMCQRFLRVQSKAKQCKAKQSKVKLRKRRPPRKAATDQGCVQILILTWVFRCCSLVNFLNCVMGNTSFLGSMYGACPTDHINKQIDPPSVLIVTNAAQSIAYLWK